MNKVVRKKRERVRKKAKKASPGKRDTHGAGVHRSPSTFGWGTYQQIEADVQRVLNDATERALGWESEGELRHVVHDFTGYQLSLDQANLFSQEVAAIVLRQLRRKP